MYAHIPARVLCVSMYFSRFTEETFATFSVIVTGTFNLYQTFQPLEL